MESKTRQSKLVKYLALDAGNEHYAINVLQVREVGVLTTLTHIPGAKPDRLGVINLRGRVIPVVDLAVRLGREPTQTDARSCIVIVQLNPDTSVGILVQRVVEVISLAPEDVDQSPSVIGEVGSVLGVTRGRSPARVLLDVASVFADMREEQSTRAAQPAADAA